MKKIFSGLIDLIFPPRRVCPLCAQSEPGSRICPACLQMVWQYRLEPVCLRCGRYFRLELEEDVRENLLLCRDCRTGQRNFFMARSAGPYEGDLKRAVQRLKFYGKRDLAGHLADIMFQSIVKNQYYMKTDIITAVPLSRERIKKRGFNQAELLAFELAGRMTVPLLPLLRKVRETSPQTGLGRSGRKENLVGSFQITRPEAVRGKTVLVVDDVITTGSTLDIVSEVLLGGGAATVICITAAAGRTSI
ncbi:MAG: hypothetical protein VR68_12825 [Peptococcaceae bacterium BRH_c4a]|nr:MAG: hypothetical protein VR68_12825 [Peptococcaceae bacterium BRH_c4a]